MLLNKTSLRLIKKKKTKKNEYQLFKGLILIENNEKIINIIMEELKFKDSEYNYQAEDIRNLIANLYVTDEEIQKIKNFNQRTPEWFKARNGVINHEIKCYIPPRLTASKVATALHHNKKETSHSLLLSLIWPEQQKKFNSFAKKIMDKGTAYETLVVKNVTMTLNSKFKSKKFQNQVWVEDVGLLVNKNYPWIAASSDGLIHIFDTDLETEIFSGLEIKVPGNSKPYKKIPHEYYDQIMCAMYILQLKDYYFACYTPYETHISHYEYNEDYWESECMPKLELFYWSQVIPSWIMKVYQRLPIGKLQNEKLINF